MRKINILCLLFGFTVFLTSCVRTESDLFDESAALRINRAVSDSREILLSAANGWVMEYFPTNAQAGVTFLIKFDKNGTATIATENEYVTTYLERTGEWELIPENGPVLTFNTYVDIFHLYSDPSGGLGKGLGLGLEGDYEFIVMDIAGDFIQLKGKKRGTDIRLYRLAENQDWKDYFTLLGNMDALFKTGIVLHLTVDDKIIYTLENAPSHTFTATSAESATDSDEAAIEIPFIITAEGIRLAKPLEVAGQSIQTFKLSGDGNSLVCTDENVDAKIEGPFPADFFFDALNLNKNMKLTDDMSPNVKAVYDKIVQSMLEKNRTLRMISVSNSKKWNTFLLIGARANATGIDTDVYFSYSFGKESESEISFAFNGFNSQTDSNSKVFYDQFAGIDDFLNLLEGKFTVNTVGSAFAPNTIKITSISNPSVWIVLDVK